MDHATDQPAWDADRLVSPHSQADKAARVRRMFDDIAPRYSLINRLFSGGRDAAWRRAAVAMAQPAADDRVLDIACGPGDFLRVFRSLLSPPALLVGCDFSHAMICEAARSEAARTLIHGPTLHWCETDALHLPFADESFTLTSCAFGVRNFQDLDQGLREMRRVLRPGGRALILEFTRPRNRLFRRLYEAYAGGLMPWAASRLSGDKTGAYRYLPRSVVSFLSAEEMRARLSANGFTQVRTRELTFGVVTIYLANRP